MKTIGIKTIDYGHGQLRNGFRLPWDQLGQQAFVVGQAFVAGEDAMVPGVYPDYCSPAFSLLPSKNYYFPCFPAKHVLQQGKNFFHT